MFINSTPCFCHWTSRFHHQLSHRHWGVAANRDAKHTTGLGSTLSIAIAIQPSFSWVNIFLNSTSWCSWATNSQFRERRTRFNWHPHSAAFAITWILSLTRCTKLFSGTLNITLCQPISTNPFKCSRTTTQHFNHNSIKSCLGLHRHKKTASHALSSLAVFCSLESTAQYQRLSIFQISRGNQQQLFVASLSQQVEVVWFPRSKPSIASANAVNDCSILSREVAMFIRIKW